jgi:hypothetical protein
MQKTEEIVKFKRGRQCTIRLDVKDWRRMMRHYRKCKAPLVADLASLDKPLAVKFLDTPFAILRGRTPKYMFHPKRINVLVRYWKRIRKEFDSLSTV